MNVPQMVDTLMERVGNASWVVVFKALITTHHLMVHGHEVSAKHTHTLWAWILVLLEPGDGGRGAVVGNGASAHLSFHTGSNIFGERACEALPVVRSTVQMPAHLKWKLCFMFIQPW